MGEAACERMPGRGGRTRLTRFAASSIHQAMLLRSAVLALIAACALLAACDRGRARAGQWFPCTCPYLTDFDDRAKHEVEVCVPTEQAAPAAAAECASRAQPAHFDPCQCRAAKGPCDGTDPCRSLEMRQ